MNQSNIRRATPADETNIADLSAQLGYPATAAEIATRLKTLLQSEDHVVFVAADADDAAVGWIHAFLTQRVESDPFIEIGGFVVSELYRGMGIGKRLLSAVEEWCRSRGVPKLRVRTRIEREDARAFYTGAGFILNKEQRVFDKRITGPNKNH